MPTGFAHLKMIDSVAAADDNDEDLQSFETPPSLGFIEVGGASLQVSIPEWDINVSFGPISIAEQTTEDRGCGAGVDCGLGAEDTFARLKSLNAPLDIANNLHHCQHIDGLGDFDKCFVALFSTPESRQYLLGDSRWSNVRKALTGVLKLELGGRNVKWSGLSNYWHLLKYFSSNEEKYGYSTDRPLTIGEFEEAGRKVCKEQYDANKFEYRYLKANCFKSVYLYGIMYFMNVQEIQPADSHDWTLGALLKSRTDYGVRLVE